MQQASPSAVKAYGRVHACTTCNNERQLLTLKFLYFFVFNFSFSLQTQANHEPSVTSEKNEIAFSYHLTYLIQLFSSTWMQCSNSKVREMVTFHPVVHPPNAHNAHPLVHPPKSPQQPGLGVRQEPGAQNPWECPTGVLFTATQDAMARSWTSTLMRNTEV